MITRLFEAKDDHMKTSNIRILVLHWTAVIVYEICNIYLSDHQLHITFWFIGESEITARKRQTRKQKYAIAKEQ